MEKFDFCNVEVFLFLLQKLDVYKMVSFSTGSQPLFQANICNHLSSKAF